MKSRKSVVLNIVRNSCWSVLTIVLFTGLLLTTFAAEEQKVLDTFANDGLRPKQEGGGKVGLIEQVEMLKQHIGGLTVRLNQVETELKEVRDKSWFDLTVQGIGYKQPASGIANTDGFLVVEGGGDVTAKSFGVSVGNAFKMRLTNSPYTSQLIPVQKGMNWSVTQEPRGGSYTIQWVPFRVPAKPLAKGA